MRLGTFTFLQSLFCFVRKGSSLLTNVSKVCQVSGTSAIQTSVACHAGLDRNKNPRVSQQKLATASVTLQLRPLWGEVGLTTDFA